MLFDLVVGIKFKKHSNEFQTKLKEDIKNIARENKMIVAADKTNNFYKVTKEKYGELLEKNINKDYKKTDEDNIKNATKMDKEIADKLELGNRIYKTSRRSAFITLKDHKPNFQNVPKCRLLNPAKSEIGIISKKILEKVIKTVRDKTGFNQWKNTKSVIDWFKDIKEKKRFKFIQFDICDFYASITPEVLNESIEYARNFVDISEEEKKIILQSKQSFLFSENTPWVKKGNSNFDVGMGSYDSAECCELVGLLLLSKLQNLKINLGIYRDDGLGVCAMTSRQIEKTKKELCQIFENHGFKITIDVNHKIVDFLDVNFNLETGLYKPYSKPNNTPLYVNKSSNHPPTILKNLPASVNKRLSSISSNEEVFNEAIHPYKNALRNSGYENELKFEPAEANNRNDKKKRSRNITWFNPPYSANVATHIGAKFLRIIDDCFPTTHILHKIINRNTVKVSYRCMPNVNRILSRHNAKVSNLRNEPEPPPGCNCQGGQATCPLDGQCQTDQLVYQATVKRTDTQTVETYTGLTGGTFKKRYNQHMSDFRTQGGETKTTLSKHIWSLKRQNIQYELSWKILARGRVFNPITKTCQLCLKEKYLIIFSPEGATLNKRTELFGTCRHRLKDLLENVKT